jgi:SanA protein
MRTASGQRRSHGRWRRRLKRLLLLAVVFLLMAIFWSDRQITMRTADQVHDRLLDVPVNHVGLVLGTSHRMRDGGPNPWFHRRMQAAAELYHAGRVNYLLLSGDNATVSYNEPRVMRQALLELGVDSAHIAMDHAGFRTLDSVVRAREVFGQNSFTVVSQRFQTERAVYIARHWGIEAVGYNARDVSGMVGTRTRIRELGARVKVFMDLLFGAQPRYLGEAVRIGIDEHGSDAALEQEPEEEEN